MSRLGNVICGYWAYLNSPKGRYEWKSYLIFLVIFFFISFLLVGVLSLELF